MYAIILAAGIGKRLHPLTKDIPKVLLPLGDTTILQFQVDLLQMANVTEIVIVTGYMAHKINALFGDTVKYVKNDDYLFTNNIYSLMLAEDYISDGFLLINGDVLFSPNLLNYILDPKYESALLVDDYNKVDDESMKVKVDNNGTVTSISKTIPVAKAYGEYIGLAKFSKEDSALLFSKIYEFIDAGKTQYWYEHAMNEILDKIRLSSVSTDKMEWVEIDTHEDYEKAKVLFPKINKEINRD